MTTLRDIVRKTVGRRHRISRGEMRAILYRAARDLDLELNIGWGGSDTRLFGSRADEAISRGAEAWERMCNDITVISVFATGSATVVQRTSSNPYDIRYDEPGSMHPLLQAEVMFAPPSACERDGTADYLRRHAKRLLIVTGERGAVPGQNMDDSPVPAISGLGLGMANLPSS